MKARCGHGVVEEWIVAEGAGVDGEVAVLRLLGQGDRRVSGLQVDGLRSHQHQGAAMLGKGVQRVQQRRASGGQQFSVARRAHRAASSPAGPSLRWGCVRVR